MKKIWIGIASLCGWKFDIPAEGERAELQRGVYIEAPHTSICDFFLGAACVWKLNVNARIFMKKEFFNWFTRRALTHFGVVPVDRGNRHNGLVGQAVKQFSENERMVFVITPEGTRKKVKRWKRGFYEIATQANVPIILTYIDYGRKVMGVGPAFYPTGDFDADMPQIMDFYRNIRARHPERFDREAYR